MVVVVIFDRHRSFRSKASCEHMMKVLIWPGAQSVAAAVATVQAKEFSTWRRSSQRSKVIASHEL